MKKIVVLVLILISLAFNFYQYSLINKNIEQISKQEKQTDALNNALMTANKRPSQHPIEAEAKKCISKVYRTIDISNCVLNSKAKWNAEIQKTLSELKKIVSPKTYALILASQKNWENYRSAQSKVIYNTIWNLKGTIYINISHMENAYITERRARELLELLRLLNEGIL